MIVNSILISAIIWSGKTTVSVHVKKTDISAESETDQQILSSMIKRLKMYDHLIRTRTPSRRVW